MERGRDDRIRVILFKTPVPACEEDSRTDPYHTILSSGGFLPSLVPVLEDTYHLDALREVLVSKEEWQGVIVTSKRGAEGWTRAVNSLDIGKTEKRGIG